MWATWLFVTKAQKQLDMKIVHKFFFDFPIPASEANPYSLIYVNLRIGLTCWNP